MNSLLVAAISTLLCLLIGYPMAYYIARSNPATRNLLMMAVMLPFWTSFLIRVYAWIGILKNNGLLNNFLMSIGLIHSPIELYHTNIAVYIGMVYSYLPFLVMPLYAHLVKMDLTLARSRLRPRRETVEGVLCRSRLPLSKNGIIAGCLLVFIPAVGEYVIPELLGGADTLMIGRVMWNEFFDNADWPMASAVTCAMVLLLLVPMALFQHYQAKATGGEAMMKPNRSFQLTCARDRVSVSLYSDRQSDCVFVQRVATGDGLDAIFAALVCGAAAGRRIDRRGVAVACASRC